MPPAVTSFFEVDHITATQTHSRERLLAIVAALSVRMVRPGSLRLPGSLMAAIRQALQDDERQ